MKTHWTERSIKDYVFRIATDFVVQLENKMESLPISRDKLAKKLGVTKGRVSQVFNNPGNITLGKIVGYSKALNMKVAIVAYENDDPDNRKGPINSEIFKICWEKAGKPRDFWAFEETSEKIMDNMQATIPVTSAANQEIPLADVITGTNKALLPNTPLPSIAISA